MTDRVPCPHPECRALTGHRRNCPLMSDTERREQFDRYTESYERRLDRIAAAMIRQHELVVMWHGRCEILRRENNALRRKLYKQSRPQEVATNDD